ncbi:hypothetical protein EVG20_g11410 [Dentipellis fragilis]|uniref:Uncharacterized protein n=1 Tax=Dentipellis fragilis TaxID=205917 RepID=A0A4Y9XLN9_9AGAM|nr:hypothetical protein EVG20_g11410 [Dentipellis fragilis]
MPDSLRTTIPTRSRLIWRTHPPYTNKPADIPASSAHHNHHNHHQSPPPAAPSLGAIHPDRVRVQGRQARGALRGSDERGGRAPVFGPFVVVYDDDRGEFTHIQFDIYSSSHSHHSPLTTPTRRIIVRYYTPMHNLPITVSCLAYAYAMPRIRDTRSTAHGTLEEEDA